MALTPVTQQSTLAKIATDPLKNFKFHVKIYHPGLQDKYPQLGFMSVSGLSVTTDVVVYRQGGMNTTTQKMPGQAQPHSARVLTPTGWKAMGDLRVGDEVVDPCGQHSRVTGVYPQGVRPVYRVATHDGGETEASDDHRWLVTVGDEREPRLLRTTDLLRIRKESNTAITLPAVQEEVVKDHFSGPPAAFGARQVAQVEYQRDEEVQCISVSADSHQYITDDLIPTHNSDFSPITLSRGLIPGDSNIYSWLQQIFMVIQGTGGTDGSQDFRAIMDIMLVDHPVTTVRAAVKAAWRIYNCWPTSIAFGDLDAGANGVELQQITLAHEGFDFKIASKGGNGPSGGVSFA